MEKKINLKTKKILRKIIIIFRKMFNNKILLSIKIALIYENNIQRNNNNKLLICFYILEIIHFINSDI